MRKILLYMVVFCMFALVAFAEWNIKVIQNPLPTSHGLIKVKKLKNVSTVEDLSSTEIPGFVCILSATVDALGNFYFFDHKYSAIVKLDKNLNFIKVFGRKGEGPGEFKTPQFASPVLLTVGLDQHFYYASLMGKRIMKFTLDGKHINTFRVQQFKAFKPAVDMKGQIFLTSTRDEYVFEVFDKQMKPVKKLVPNSIRSSFLFSTPPDCLIPQVRVPDSYFLKYQFLKNGDLLALNTLDVSIMIIDKNSGEIKKQFYAWDDYILAEFELRLNASLKKAKALGATCGYSRSISNLFVDSCDEIYLSFLDSQKNKYIFQYTLKGELKQVYRIDTQRASALKFFHTTNDRFYAFSRTGVYVFAQ